MFTKWKRLITLIFALLQPLSAWLVESGDNGLFDGGRREPFIAPAGYAFSVWSVIVLGTIAYAIYQLSPSTYSRKIYDQIAFRSAAVFAGFAIWLWFAANQWLSGTVVVFIVMGVLLRSIFLAIKSSSFTPIERLVVIGSFSVYYGWTTVAIFANLASALVFYGWPNTGILGLTWQASVLLAAAALSLFLLKETRYHLGYFLTILWAFCAIVVGTVTVGREAIVLTFLALAATLYILFKGWQSIKN